MLCVCSLQTGLLHNSWLDGTAKKNIDSEGQCRRCGVLNLDVSPEYAFLFGVAECCTGKAHTLRYCTRDGEHERGGEKSVSSLSDTTCSRCSTPRALHELHVSSIRLLGLGRRTRKDLSKQSVKNYLNDGVCLHYVCFVVLFVLQCLRE